VDAAPVATRTNASSPISTTLVFINPLVAEAECTHADARFRGL
jgi:hypothetical protein